jgi:hypothetical protein
MRKRTHPLPTVEQLHAKFDYDPRTGLLTRKRNQSVAATRQKKTGYLTTSITGQMILVHRIAWAMHYGDWPTGELDHRDSDRSNNRIANLREATRSQQAFNKLGRNPNKCVRVRPLQDGTPRYSIRISAHLKAHYLGTYKTLTEALAAHRAAAILLHGEFANQNSFPSGKIVATIDFNSADTSIDMVDSSL